jgi:membrane protein DedA with SNARE-associated domain
LSALAVAVLLSALHGVLRSLERAFAHYSYAILFGLVAAESFSFPLPGEVSLLLSAYEASRSRMDLSLTILVASSAAILGDNLAYLAGRYAGRPLITRFFHVLRVHEKRLEQMDAYFERYLGKTVFAARWISPLRGLTALFSGASRVAWRRFFIFNALGGITWATTVTIVGFLFARHIGELESLIDEGGLVALGLIVLAALGYLLYRRRRARAAALAEHKTDAREHETREPGPKDDTCANTSAASDPERPAAGTGCR